MMQLCLTTFAGLAVWSFVFVTLPSLQSALRSTFLAAFSFLPASFGTVHFAVDAVAEGFLSRAEAIATIDAGSLKALLHPTFAAGAHYTVVARGVAASPGAAKGAIVFTAPDAVAAAEDRRAVILVRPFTEADDVAGFHAAAGILTTEGGKASHAALVARGMGGM